jgi:putative CocE/NonD family hydrolase
MSKSMNLVRSAFLLAVLTALGACAITTAPSSPTDVAVTPRRAASGSDQSYYLVMRDGVRVALSLYFPKGTAPQNAATILVQTRYGRAATFQAGDHFYARWTRAGYVVAIVDTRGSTSSFGSRIVDIGPDEVADMDEIIAHLASQPWSSGEVIAHGFSYMADTADWATSRPAPALVASLPRQTDFDMYTHLFLPGGVSNDWFLSSWGSATRKMDLGRSGRDDGLDCVERAADCAALFPTLQPVDGDESFTLLREALTGRVRWGPESYMNAEFRDDLGGNGYSLFSSGPASALADIRRERKPVQYWGSWMDGGTAEAALARYRSAPEVPMEVWITGNNHGGNVGADPFLPNDLGPRPSVDEQFAANLNFVDRVRSGESITRIIHYYVLGAGVYRSTNVWPPADAGPRTLYLNASELGERPGPEGTRRYEVDFGAGTGDKTRWSTQFGTPPAYPDRRDADSRLLVFDSAPLSVDTEVVGTPVLTLYVASQSRDPAFFAYLEDVAPDGRVTYLTEGMLRAVHRRIADPASLPYDQGPAAHSFRRADAMQVTPGEVMEVRFALFPVAALIRSGHRLRVAIAGADRNVFRIYSGGGPDTYTISYGGARQSRLELNLRPWAP